MQSIMHTQLLLVLAAGVLLRSQLASAWFWESALNQPAPASAAVTAMPVTNPAQTHASMMMGHSKGPVTAEARFDGIDGVTGSIKFMQISPEEATQVRYNLGGLKGNNKFYHVHVRRVPPFDDQKVRTNATLIAENCAATGGHHNPHNITEKLAPLSAPFDRYEIGDLSGKHGPLIKVSGGTQPVDDHYAGGYRDMFLPMLGENGIVGRSIVIHKNDGKRWVCATIEQVTANPNFLH